MNPAFFAKIERHSSNPPNFSIKKYIKRYNEKEIETVNKIKKIPRYFCFFAPFIKHSFLQVPDKYVVLYQEELIPFYDFFQNIHGKEKKMHIQSSFLHIVKAFQVLRDHDILYGNYGKIGFNRQNQPILYEFERNIVDLQYFPVEMHVIALLQRESCSSLSLTNIDAILETFSDKSPSAPSFLRELINKPKQQIIDALWKYRYTWDNYALSMLYLNFDETERESALTTILLQALAFIPEERPSHEDILLTLL